jgi:hypothetical protein
MGVILALPALRKSRIFTPYDTRRIEAAQFGGLPGKLLELRNPEVIESV